MNGASKPDLPLVIRQDRELLMVLGPESIDRLASYLEEIGGRRAYLVTGRTLASGPAGGRVRAALGPLLVGSFAGARPHVPIETSEAVANEARSLRADVIVGLGGGSPIGTAKAAAFALLEMRGPKPDPPCIVAAIPTTYAGSEVTPVFGTTDLAKGRKTIVRSDPVRPRLALYDPQLAVETPSDLTASTGINALAHCVEGLYAKECTEADREMALRAAGRILEYLPRAAREPRNVGYRYHLFEGSMEAGLVLARVGMGVHHGLCHVLGGRFNAPHGVLNAIVLPHAMRFNIPVAGRAYGGLAPLLGVRWDGASPGNGGEKVCAATAAFIRGFGLPQRLRDIGIPRADLRSVAEEALLSKAVKANPRPVSLDDARGILEAAW